MILYNVYNINNILYMISIRYYTCIEWLCRKENNEYDFLRMKFDHALPVINYYTKTFQIIFLHAIVTLVGKFTRLLKKMNTT